MSDKERPLGVLERANEESYFRRRERELIERMRRRNAREEQARALGEASGVTDEALLRALVELGVRADTAPALHLLPLVQVAWADGRLEPAERALILQAADRVGPREGPARGFLEGLLDARPSEALVTAGLDFVARLISGLPPEDQAAARADLGQLTWRVAKAAGGLFGRLWSVDAAEAEALRQIARALHTARPEASSRVLSTLR